MRAVTEFRHAWAVLARVTSPYKASHYQSVDILRVYWEEADAVAEVVRLKGADPNDAHRYYHTETEVERSVLRSK